MGDHHWIGSVIYSELAFKIQNKGDRVKIDVLAKTPFTRVKCCVHI